MMCRKGLKQIKQTTLNFAPPPKKAPEDQKPYAKWLYKNPQHSRTKYFNSILPDMYQECYPLLQTKFESYFFKEREWRYELTVWKDDILKKLNAKLAINNPAAYGKYLSETFKYYQPVHKQYCSKGIEELEPVDDAIKEKSEELKVARGDLYIGNTLKPGKKEKDRFLESAIADVESLGDRCNDALKSLRATLERLDSIMKGITEPAKGISFDKKKRKADKKAKKRKEAR